MPYLCFDEMSKSALAGRVYLRIFLSNEWVRPMHILCCIQLRPERGLKSRHFWQGCVVGYFAYCRVRANEIRGGLTLEPIQGLILVL
jgi:hypothetical protein